METVYTPTHFTVKSTGSGQPCALSCGWCTFLEPVECHRYMARAFGGFRAAVWRPPK